MFSQRGLRTFLASRHKHIYLVLQQHQRDIHLLSSNSKLLSQVSMLLYLCAQSIQHSRRQQNCKKAKEPRCIMQRIGARLVYFYFSTHP